MPKQALKLLAISPCNTYQVLREHSDFWPGFFTKNIMNNAHSSTKPEYQCKSFVEFQISTLASTIIIEMIPKTQISTLYWRFSRLLTTTGSFHTRLYQQLLLRYHHIWGINLDLLAAVAMVSVCIIWEHWELRGTNSDYVASDVVSSSPICNGGIRFGGAFSFIQWSFIWWCWKLQIQHGDGSWLDLWVVVVALTLTLTLDGFIRSTGVGSKCLWTP